MNVTTGSGRSVQRAWWLSLAWVAAGARETRAVAISTHRLDERPNQMAAAAGRRRVHVGQRLRCDNQLCDKARSVCVDCTDNSSCQPQETCEKSKCVDFTPCMSSLDCTVGAVCDKTKMRCVECVMSADCKDGQTCAEGTCRASCISDKTVAPPIALRHQVSVLRWMSHRRRLPGRFLRHVAMLAAGLQAGQRLACPPERARARHAATCSGLRSPAVSTLCAGCWVRRGHADRQLDRRHRCRRRNQHQHRRGLRAAGLQSAQRVDRR